MPDTNNDEIQKIPLNSITEPIDKKRARIELRGLKDAIPLGTRQDANVSSPDLNLVKNLQRVTGYCTSEQINIRELCKELQNTPNFTKATMYFGECLYTCYTSKDENFDLFFFEYGVVIFWGLSEYQESVLLKNMRLYEINSYDASRVEIESFKFGIVEENSAVINDIICLNSGDHLNKMVISCAIAQSLRLDVFESLVDSAISGVKDLPLQVEKAGKVGKSRKEIMRLMGKLHGLKLNVNLVSNILDEPELLWHHPHLSSYYRTIRAYLDINSRADVLNHRVDVIQNILNLLSQNITTRNSEGLEKIIIVMNVFNICIMTILCCILWLTKK